MENVVRSFVAQTFFTFSFQNSLYYSEYAHCALCNNSNKYFTVVFLLFSREHLHIQKYLNNKANAISLNRTETKRLSIFIFQ